MYYEARAAEYDATTYELAKTDPEAARDLLALEALVAGLTADLTLDVGCGTGWLTRLLRGRVVALDPSKSMLGFARQRIPDALLIWASAPPLPFLDDSFDRILTSHVYGHLEALEARQAFVDDALRVADELVVIEQPRQSGRPLDAWEDRTLRDGSTHRIYKRYFHALDLAEELGGDVILDTRTFVAARTTRASRRRAPDG
jgi:ubiquinone/menaquinone biosynthesis C-methylase UbiE